MMEFESIQQPPSYKIQIVETPTPSVAYTTDRDKIWKERVEEGKKIGKKFFNGTLYRYMGMKNEGSFEPTLLLGHMTYADRLMKTVIPIEEIGNRYGENHSMIHTCVDAIITTTDHKIVYGVKKMSTDLKPGKIGYISGNMNADEVRVSIFEDIYRMMSKEISEEANIKPERERLSFIKLGLSNGWASFYFLYRLGISSTELNKIEKDDEFDHFESAYPQEIARMVRIATSDFNFSKGFIENLKL